jgi:hypothetical protein
MCFIVSKQVLELVIQHPCWGKEEGENWRQRSRNPSVPVSLFIELEINSITGTERSEERQVATLHTDGSRGNCQKRGESPAHTLFPCRAPRSPRPGALAHCNTASFPKKHARSHLTFPPLFSLVSRFSKNLVLNACPT